MAKKIEPDKKWYEYDEVKVGYGACLEPYQNIIIGTYPMDGATKEWADQFDAVVNVSCNHSSLFEPSRPDQRTYWYPTNEMGEWSYAMFALMFKVLDFHHSKGHKIYVHCAAGAYRSPSIVMRWLEYKGVNLLDAYEISHGKRMSQEEIDSMDNGNKHYRLFQNYIFGNLPPNYQEFIRRLRYHNEETGYTFVCALEGGKNGYISNSPQIRAHRLNDKFRRGWRYWYGKLKSKIEDTKRKYKLYRDCVKYIQLEKGHYVAIREMDRIGSNRKHKMDEFYKRREVK